MNPVVRFTAALSLVLAALSAAPAAHAVDSGDIVVTSVKGEVHATMKGAARPLRAGLVLELPATVRTGANGAVDLRQGATVVSVAADTLLEFPALEKRGAPIDRIVQPSGNAFYDVGRREARKLRVETPYLVAVIKGTQFNVAVQDEAATISLFEGKLEVHAADESAVVDLNAGEIARRRRADKTITIFKMDPKLVPAPQRAPQGGSDNGRSNNGGFAPNTPRGNTDNGDSLLADRDAPSTNSPAPAVTARPSLDPRGGVDVGAGNTSGEGAMSVAAGSNVSAGAGTVGADLGTSVAVSVTPAAADVAAGVSASVAPGAVEVATNVRASVDLTPVSVDVAANTSVDVAPAGASVDVGASAALDAGRLTTVADVAAAVDLSGAGASATVDVDVAAGAGPASVAVGAATGVDLGTSPAASVVVDVANVGGVAAAAAATADVATGTVDLGLGLSDVGVDLGVDLGLDDKEDTNTSTDTPDTGTVVDVGGLLDGLLRRPGRKK